MNNDVKIKVEKLLDLWDSGYNVEFAYQISLIYSTGDIKFIYDVIEEFTESIKTIYGS